MALSKDGVGASAPDADGDSEEEIASDADEDTFVMEESLPPSVGPSSFASVLLKPTRLLARHSARGAGDTVLVCAIVAVVYGLVMTTGRLFSTTPYTSLAIGTSLGLLPWYAAQSLTRMLAGYFVSLLFALSYAYVAYRVPFIARGAMLAIDVLQSIPLLSFLPGVVLGLMALFPGARAGVELAAVLLLFTSMAWNMLMGFYQSLQGIPRDLEDVAHAFRLSPWKRFWALELPAGAIGLIWNSVISVAGGWFFLISIESFELGNRDFRLPGLGSFLAAAAEAGDYSAILAGLGVVVAIIVVIDFFIWQPLIAWSTKFTYGSPSNIAPRPRSPVLLFLQRSVLMRSLHTRVFGPLWESFVNLGGSSAALSPAEKEGMNIGNTFVKGSDLTRRRGRQVWKSLSQLAPFRLANKLVRNERFSEITPYFLQAIVVAITFAVGGIAVLRALKMVKVLSFSTWMSLGTASLLTFGRVFTALSLSLLWTIPAGVTIGRNRELSAKLQPLVQIAASVPATALFPFVLLFLAKLGGGLQIGSVALMMLGTMWYVLFNVIAGAQAIPEELFDVDTTYNKEGWLKQWRTLVLPGIFPYLITGIVTAVGGAWNASIVSEYVVFRGGVMKTHGLGSLISEAAASGNYALLLAGTVVMSVLVLLTNRFVWGPLYQLAETKYRI